jgi:hypothetical protein
MVRKSKEQLEDEERQFYDEQAKRGPGAIPVGACIVRPGSRGVIGIRPKAAADPPKKA